ncbi:hypothetical protein H6F78_02020 [Coleofasciculus sp. FACHB-64]|uniref:hypothetical protein n=1 Tax=Cyanophyceae TaxID=3028117 RepID=UPI001685B234|nr:hypothetical protein [Coleofasciculus sp. FACHB-64]MBD2044417.1 hypothetical protein [Coleofasciculus sp. FACHB-64]
MEHKVSSEPISLVEHHISTCLSTCQLTLYTDLPAFPANLCFLVEIGTHKINATNCHVCCHLGFSNQSPNRISRFYLLKLKQNGVICHCFVCGAWSVALCLRRSHPPSVLRVAADAIAPLVTVNSLHLPSSPTGSQSSGRDLHKSD